MSVLVLRVSCLTLFNLQGARLRASQSPVSAQLLYHSFRSLSRTFFIFFQVLFLAHPLSGTAARDSFDRIPLYPSFVKGFFEVFSFFLEKAKIRRIPAPKARLPQGRIGLCITPFQKAVGRAPRNTRAVRLHPIACPSLHPLAWASKRRRLSSSRPSRASSPSTHRAEASSSNRWNAPGSPAPTPFGKRAGQSPR